MDFSTNTGALPGNDLGRPVEGEFRTRLTVRADRPATVSALGRWAVAHGLELTQSVQDRGLTPCRPALTLHGTGTLDEQRATAGEWTARLAAAGFGVVGTKIQAAPWNVGVPQTDGDAGTLPAYCRFEHHITLRLPIPYDTRRLTALAQAHAAHVSRTVRRSLPGGVQERFVTQRARGLGRPGARALLNALLDALAVAGFQPVDIAEEFVLHDDNPAVDSGWIEERNS